MLLYVAHDFESVEKAENFLLALQKTTLKTLLFPP